MNISKDPSKAPIIVWFRRDLRLADNPALFQAVASKRPVLCLFIYDEIFRSRGAAPKWRLSKSLEDLAQRLRTHANAQLVLKKGNALSILKELVAQTGASGVYWNRCYSPDEIERDRQIKTVLKADEIDVRSFQASLMFEPHSITNKSGSFFKVYSPFWRAVASLEVRAPLPEPAQWEAGDVLKCDVLADWGLERAMSRGAEVLTQSALIGEAAAQDRLEAFSPRVEAYSDLRNTPGVDGTSQLSAALSLGELSPHQIYHHITATTGPYSMGQWGKGRETYIKELVWREFAYHLMYHTPHILSTCWRPEWDQFPWQAAPEPERFQAWCYGMTGYEFVDAAMRELYVTGMMHNRSRMIVASFLTKHLGIDWRLGMNWFENCLIDWDPASNAMGWQWVAGCGPDASPYFRVFNPITQLQKFDSDGRYVAKWLGRGPGALKKSQSADLFFHAVPKSLGLSADMAYPEPMIAHDKARVRALEAYETFKREKEGSAE